MEVKKVTVESGHYDCDIDLGVEDWIELLLDETLTSDNTRDILIKFHNEPEHKSTCKNLSEKYQISAQSINGNITAFAKAIKKKLNRFEIIGIDGNPTYWIIVMTGKNIGEHFEWKMRDELIKAMEKLDILPKHALQLIYETAIEENHWVFYDWFPFYEECVINYRKNAIAKKWSDTDFQKLVKNTTGNGISDLRQKNFEWKEFEQIKQNWSKVEDIIKLITENNHIDTNQYQKIISFFRTYTKENRPSASNRVLSAFLPNFLTTTVKQDFLTNVMGKTKKICPDFPSITYDWLQDNINFIDYCNKHIQFQHPWHSSLFAWYLKEYFGKIEQLNRKNTEMMNQYINLLKTNKNIILTGAPGTGKTYLAKQIALSFLFQKNNEAELTVEELQVLNKHFCFVQFHPSYDYTDFVEGLRAEDLNGQVIFNLHNGILKEFCKRAIVKPVKDNFDEVYDNLINDITENDFEFNTPVHKKKFKVEINSNKSCVAIPSTNIGTRMSMTKDMIRDYIIYDKIRDWKPYVTAIGDYLKKNYKLIVEQEKNENYPYIFVIDEINRGEISKIFGELFFSIDPSYRGKNGKVKTQYANIQNGETIFDDDLGKGWFYVPENVFIIGTMNDIDRSVESMDFAMRRRFAWKEILAIDRIAMWDGAIDEWKEEALLKMISLNKQLEQIQGLSSAYHIGPAYFLKLQNYNGDFDVLWENHLKGILNEYLRGLPNAEDELKTLKSAYFLMTPQ
ncbi:McrB family protein [Flavobacterium magnesitis]|uniref:McrB family protein n=1 Tax=Flavobacterium magnesitis TaxID=3138077 RepID=UPI00358EF53B